MEDDLDTGILALLHDHVDGEVAGREGDGVVFGGDGLFPELSIQGAIIIIVFHKELPAITERLVSESNGHGLLRLPGVAVGIQNGDVEAGQLVLSRGGGSGSTWDPAGRAGQLFR